MFCGDMPCTCNSKPKTKNGQPRPKPQAVSAQPKSDSRAAMRTAASSEEFIYPDDSDPMIQLLGHKLGIQQHPVDMDTAAALIALDMHGLIQGDDKYRYGHVLGNVELRRRLWQDRRKS